MPSGWLAGGLEKVLMASKWIGTGGRQAMGNMLFVDEAGQLQLTINHERMREVWMYLRELYAEAISCKTILCRRG